MDPDLSVTAVIPFRNRGPERLRLAARSILESTAHSCEVVISDYGSDEPEIAQQVARETGSRVVFTPADHWSRSAALNAGFAHGRGQVFLGADADIIWGPGAIDAALESLNAQPRQCIAFECQFMGPEVTVARVEADPHDWDLFDRSSKLNPRWGVGMLFFPRALFELTNGYEARMRTYGYEDNDFSNRVRALGYRVRWEGSGEHRAYHIWHERPGLLAKTDKKLAAEYAANKEIFLSNHSVVRNVVGARGAAPLVTVAIATHDRAEMLRTAVASALCQTVTSLEVVVVDDGSTDDTADVVAEFGDPRVRYIRQEKAGISSARNRALSEARGRYTAVMDDGDIMPPWRLERSFESIHAGEHGCVGSFVTFDDASGEMVSWADPHPTLLGATRDGGFAGHPTWMIRTDVLRAFGYDQLFTSAVDNNIALRMLRSGVQLRHAEAVLNLRRVHGGQVTTSDSAFQGRGARLDATWLRTGTTAKQWRAAAEEARKTQVAPGPTPQQREEVLPFLPDHLVRRAVSVRTTRTSSAEAIRARHPDAAHLTLQHPDGSTTHLLHITEATWPQCAYIARQPDTHITHWDVSRHLDAGDVGPVRQGPDGLMRQALAASHWISGSMQASPDGPRWSLSCDSEEALILLRPTRMES